MAKIDRQKMIESTKKAEELAAIQAEARMRDILRQRISGSGVHGNPISDPEHRESVRLWEELKRSEDERGRQTLERQDRLLLEARRLDLEEERLRIEKANVVVRLIEAGVQGGLKGEQLLGMIGGVADRLLPETAPLAAQLLEDKSRAEAKD